MSSDRLDLAANHMKIGGDAAYAQLLILLDMAHSLRGIYEQIANGGDIPR